MTKYNLKYLAHEEGREVMEMLEAATYDSDPEPGVPSICTSCGYIDRMEPDCSNGFCHECDNPTMQSCLCLAGIM